MRYVTATALITTLLTSAAQAEMQETVVTLTSDGQDMIATLARPAGAPAPVVLMLHGFTGSRDELVIPSTGEGIFSHTAARLADQGFASLRIDFRGSGDSTSDFTYERTTFEGQITDALAAIDYLSALDTVDGSDIHVIGWSQGGLVASAVAGRSGRLDAVALWQAVGDAEATYGGILGAETLTKGKAAAPGETITATLPWGAEVQLNGAFFDGIETVTPMAEIAKFHGPLFVTQGLTDTTVMPSTAADFINAHDGPEQLWTTEMDHVFNAFATTDTLNQMIDATAAFFTAQGD